MAVYLGVYTDDFNRKTFVKLDVFLFSNDTRQNTDVSFDNDYLPEVYKSFVTVFDRTLPSCPKTITHRHAKLYLNSIDCLHVDLPFHPSSSEYNQFLIAISFNPSIVTVGMQGETITNYYLKYAVS